MELTQDTIAQLGKIRLEFGIAFEEGKHFLLLSYLSQIISSTMLIETHPDQNSDIKTRLIASWPRLQNDLEQYEQTLAILGGANGYNWLVTEKAFLDAYRIFENFVADIFILLGLSAPDYLVAEKDNVKIDPGEIFEKTSLVQIRRHVIEREVQQALFGKGIWPGISGLFKKFDLKLQIDQKVLNNLNLASILRNTIMHHGSKMNSATVRHARKLGLIIPIEPGESIRKYLYENLWPLRDNLGDLAVMIYKSIVPERTDEANSLEL